MICYDPCKSGYYGVGPVCWSNTPNGWVGCGMGAAKSAMTCGSIILNQVMSVGQMTMNLATLGVASTASTATAAAGQANEKVLKTSFQ